MSVVLPGKSHGQRGLGGCSPRGGERAGHDLAAKTTKRGQLFVILKFYPDDFNNWVFNLIDFLFLYFHLYFECIAQSVLLKCLLNLPQISIQISFQNVRM